MRSLITFDTLEYMDELKKAGMRPEEAEAITKATAKALAQLIDTKELVTKNDLNECMWKTISILATFQTVTLTVFGLIYHFVK